MVSFVNLLLILLLWTGLVTTQSSDYTGPQFNCTVEFNGDRESCKFEANATNPSCSFQPLQWFNGPYCLMNGMTLSCAGTSKVTVNLTHGHFTGFSGGCSAEFPLDVDVDTVMPPGSTISCEKTGATFTTALSNSRTSEDIAGNFIFLSTHNASRSTVLNITIELYRQPHLRLSYSDTNEFAWFETAYPDGLPVLSCETPLQSSVSMTVGVDPANTGLLLKCLSLKGPYCQTTLRGQHEYYLAKSDSRKRGAVYCSFGKRTISRSYFSPVSSCEIKDVSEIWEESNVIQIQRDDLESHFVVNFSGPSGNPITNVTIFEKEFVGQECHFLRYAVGPHPISWVIKYQNGTEHTFTSNEETTEEKHCKGSREFEDWPIRTSSIWENSSHIQIEGHAGMIAVECQANYWNFNGTANAALNVKIKGRTCSWLHFRRHKCQILSKDPANYVQTEDYSAGGSFWGVLRGIQRASKE